jgi:hypothetical protein
MTNDRRRQEMDRVAFYGDMETGDLQVAAGLLSSWLGRDDLVVKSRVAGDEITYEDEATYVYCHEADTSAGNAPFFLLEGQVAGPLASANEQLSALARLCDAGGVGCGLDYVQLDDDGDQVGEEFTVSVEA